MSFNKRFNMVLILTILGFSILIAIMFLGHFFPGESTPNVAPWYVWAAIAEVIVYFIVTMVIGFIVRKQDKQLKEQE